MTALGETLALPNGARFHRVDLHIHSFSGSHDVVDATMTPAEIVKTALTETLDVIAVADHNEIANVEATLSAAAAKPVLVIPAIELSTPDGHLLCFLPTLDALQRFFGRIAVVDRSGPNSRCQNSIVECLNHLEQLAGFGILAHVDAAGGFESLHPTNTPYKLDVLCHRTLLGIELRSAASQIAYSDADPDPQRQICGTKRISSLGLGSRQYLARMLNSDSHTLAALGRNAQGDRRLTRVKMDRPSFEGLRIALEDSDARLRLEDQIPPSVPRVLGMHIDGGFLDGQRIHFSPNLNCIIGGRGTGKSTAFEAVRCLTGEPSRSSVIDSDVWPAQLLLFWQDQAGQRHSLSRPIGGTLSNLDDPVKGPVAFLIESYGQGETAHISREAHDNPVALLSYLDRFVEIREPLANENTARDELLGLQTEIEKATTNVEAIPQYERALATTQQQLSALEQARAKDVIALQRKLASEREIRSQISTKLATIEQRLETSSPKAILDEILALADPTTLAVGAEEFKRIAASARAFEADATAARAQAKASFLKLRAAAELQITSWKAKESEALKSIETQRKALEAQSIRLDMAYIQKLAQDEAKLKSDLTALRMWQPHLEELKRKRAHVSKRRWAARERVSTLREAFARTATETLKTALIDLFVSLKFLSSAHSPDAEQQIVQAMGWRTIQVPRAALLIQSLTVPGLLAAIDNRDVNSIASIVTDEGVKVFDKVEAGRVVQRLADPSIRFALERCEVYDLPRLTVTRPVKSPDGSTSYVRRDFSRLSLGQQQSVLLALMLSSKSNAPLIIDQPEDNLDGQFIYRSLVPVLRLAKERRQIIIVTHNANIAVLGDAELIVVLRSTHDKGTIVSRACGILEGAKEAFQRRSKIYGIR